MSPAKRGKWWVFFVTTSGTSLVFLDSTVMPVALPTLQKQFQFSDSSLVWIVNAYLLSLTALLLIGGRLSDLFGKRALFAWGLTIFGIGSMMCGFSSGKTLMLTGRVIQGIGGALTLPTTGALLMSAFPQGERAKAIGINTGISSIFLILGPALGGFFTEYVSWRGIFFLNVPIVIFGIAMTFLILKPGSRKHETFHFSGAIFLIAGVTCLVVSLMEANNWGWSSFPTLFLLIISPFFFFLFYWVSTKVKHPLIDFHFFKKKTFAIANLCIIFVQMVVMVTVLWAIYFQKDLGYSPAQTGLLIFIAAFPVFLMAPLGGYLGDRFGPRLPTLAGFAGLTFSLYWLLITANFHSFKILLPGLLGFGCSIPLIMSPTIAMALSSISEEKLGAASGITTEARQLASTTGIALMTAIYVGVLSKTGSHVKAFGAISFFAGCFSVLGFLVVLLGTKDNQHNHY